MRKKIAIDLGSQNTHLWSEGKVLLSEPTVVAISNQTNRIVAIGAEAHSMLGKTPDTLVAVKPVVGGVVADFTSAQAFLKIILARVSPSFSLLRPDIMMTVPYSATPVERKASLELALEAGAAHAYIVESPLVAGIGAGMAVSGPNGNVVMHVGAEVSDVAVISLGGIVTGAGARIGGTSINDAIKQYVKAKHGIVIGEMTAEEVKQNLGSAEEASLQMNVSGRDTVFGLPRSVNLSSSELLPVIKQVLSGLTAVVREALENVPPELSSDIIDKGIVLTGGGAYFRHLDKYLATQTGIPAHIGEDPEYCAVRGAGVVLENLELWRRSVTTKS